MADNKTELGVKVKFDDSDMQRAKKNAREYLDVLKNIEDWQADAGDRKKKRHNMKWGTIGRGMAMGGMVAAGGAVGGFAAAMGGSLPGVITGLGAAAAGGLTVLGNTIKGLSKIAGGLITEGGGKIKTVLKKLPFIGDVMEGFAKVMGLGSAAFGQVAQQRMNVAQQVADYDKAAIFSQLSGGENMHGSTATSGTWRTARAYLAQSPMEAAATRSQAAMAAGMRGSMINDERFFRAMSWGASSGALGGLMGAGGTARVGGRGGVTSLLTNVVAAALNDGLRGSRLDQALGQASQTINQLAGMGMRQNITQYGRMAVGMQRALRGRAAAGTAGNVTSQLALMPGKAKQQLLAPFAGISNALVMAEAARRGGGGMEGILGALETMGPEGALAAHRAGGRAGGLALAQFGPSTAIDAMLGARPGSSGFYGRTTQMAAAQAKARTQAEVLESMRDKKRGLTFSDNAAKMIKSMGSLQGEIQKMASGLDGFLQQLPTFIKEGIEAINK